MVDTGITWGCDSLSLSKHLGMVLLIELGTWTFIRFDLVLLLKQHTFQECPT